MPAHIPMDDSQLRRSWFAFFALGVILVILGMVAMGHAVFMTFVTVQFYGFLLIGGGILQAANGFWQMRWSGFFLDVLAGLLYLFLGLMFVIHPEAAALVLTLLIAMVLMVAGVFRLIAAISGQFPNWFWIFAHGLISLLLGISIWRGWPLSGVEVIGLFVAIDFLLNGFALIMLGLGLRSAAKQVGPAGS
jgi:uncharacterized membrane protein HdeD (DUF308 family)